MAYVVGLLATDGCLSKDRRHIVLTSTDLELILTYLRCLRRPIRYTIARRRKKRKRAYYAQFSDVEFYDWLLSIGLHPRKSLTLGAIDVPSEFLAALVRGLLDGDGSISVFTHTPTRARYPTYMYERLWVLFVSASQAHIDWLQARIASEWSLRGRVERVVRKKKRDFFRLKYGKRESIALLRRLYEDPGSPRLERKWRRWDDFVKRSFGAEGGI